MTVYFWYLKKYEFSSDNLPYSSVQYSHFLQHGHVYLVGLYV